MEGNGIVLGLSLVLSIGKLCQPWGKDKEMVKTTNRNTHTNKSETETATAGTAENVVEIRKPKGKRGNIFETEKHQLKDDPAHSLQVQQQARQLLAEARDKFDQAGSERGGDDKMGTGLVREAKEIAAKAALLLTTARINNEITAEQVNGILGDIFSFKPMKDGKPGKTPMGQGEALRKRIQRLTTARDYVSGANSQGFFEGCPKKNVEEILTQTLNGTRPFWQAYEDLAKVKNAMRSPPPPLAFNVKKIIEIAETLKKEEAVKIFVDNEALVDAYADLLRLARTVGEQAYELAQQAA